MAPNRSRQQKRGFTSRRLSIREETSLLLDMLLGTFLEVSEPFFKKVLTKNPHEKEVTK